MRVRNFILFALILGMCGCSVGMAMSGKKDPQMGQVRVGATRGEIEMQLGSPKQTVSLSNGMRQDLYTYEIGNEPSAGRAIGHGVMDILTLGLWEVVGTPIEGVQGDQFDVTIVYDADDLAQAINAPVKRSPATNSTAGAPVQAAAPAQAGKSVKLIGVSDGVNSGAETDKKEAILDAKAKVCAAAGVKLNAAQSCDLSSVYAVEVDAETEKHLEPNYEIVDIGYDTDQKAYKVVLIGTLKTASN